MQREKARRDLPPPQSRQARRAFGVETFLSRKCAEGFDWYRTRSPELGPIRRGDIDPISMQGFLQHIVLVDVERTPPAPCKRTGRPRLLTFRFSLVGGHIDTNYDERLKGRYLHDLDLNIWRPYWLNAYELPVHKRYPVTDRVNVVWRDMDFMTLEYVFVPVVNDAGDIDRLLIVEEFSIDDEDDG